MPIILACSFLVSRVRLSAVWPCKCRLTFSQVCSDWLYSWGVTQKVVMFQSHFKHIYNLRHCTSSSKSSIAFFYIHQPVVNLIYMSLGSPVYSEIFVYVWRQSFFTVMKLFRTQNVSNFWRLRQREKKNVLILPTGVNH